MLDLLLPALLAFGVSLVVVPVCRMAALGFGCTAKPKADRWHSRPTALFGGVGIVATVLALHVLISGPRELPVLLVGGGLIFGVGLADDVLTLKPYSKLVAEIAIASLFVFFGYRLAWSGSPTLDTFLTMFWIVGLTNAFNLLDNMDGLCAGVCLIAGSSLLAAFVLEGGVTSETAYLAVLLGATAGFLVYNFHPASIFMGDSGSLFVGLNLAVLTLDSPSTSYGATNLLSVLGGPVLVLLVPIFDTTLVTVSRVLSGRSAVQGGRDHLSHRLVAIGLSERSAVMVLWVLAALGGVLAFSIYRWESDWTKIVLVAFLLAVMVLAAVLARIRVYDRPEDALLRGEGITPFTVNFMYKRRVAEVLLDVCLVSVGYYAVYWLRFQGSELSRYHEVFLTSLPIVVGVQMIALFVVGTYRGVWRHFGLMDGVTLGKGVFLGTLTSIAVVVYLYRFEDYSRGVFVIYAALLMSMLSGSRTAVRLLGGFAQRRRQRGKRLVIYGAGDEAAAAVLDLLSQTAEEYWMLGFIDDDPTGARARVSVYPVLGDHESLAFLISNRVVDAVVITTPLVSVQRLETLRALCVEHDVSLTRVPVRPGQLGAVS